MAKKNSKEVDDEPEDLVVSAVSKKWQGSLISPNAIISDTTNSVIGISPSLNLALNGGCITGSGLQLSGKAKSGKSTTAAVICAQAQKQGRKCYWLSIENRMRRRDLLGIEGLKLDQENFEIVKSTKNKILSGEDFLDIGLELVKNAPGSVIVFDSLSALCSEKELIDDTIGTKSFGGFAQTVKKFTKIISNLVPVTDCLVIYICHVYESMTGYGGQVTGSGTGPKYFSDTILRIKSTKPLLAGDKQIGQEITWALDNTPLGKEKMVTPPTSVLRYGVGLCRLTEILTLAPDVNLISKGAGGRYVINGVKLHGTEAAYEYLLENPDVADDLEYEIYNSLNPDIISLLNLKKKETISA